MKPSPIWIRATLVASTAVAAIVLIEALRLPPLKSVLIGLGVIAAAETAYFVGIQLLGRRAPKAPPAPGAKPGTSPPSGPARRGRSWAPNKSVYATCALTLFTAYLSEKLKAQPFNPRPAPIVIEKPTPLAKLRIPNVDILDEHLSQATSTGHTLTDYHPRSNACYEIDQDDDLKIAFAFSALGFQRRSGEFKLQATIIIKDSLGKEIWKATDNVLGSLQEASQRTNIRTIGLGKVTERLNLTAGQIEDGGAVPYVMLITDFSSNPQPTADNPKPVSEIPLGKATLTIRLRDLLTGEETEQIEPFEVIRRASRN